ncbi:MAG: ubiquinol-cytochrome c reductase cytochrome c1 subunit [Gammaproteobacteria bacterium]|jgi:ubiquinol-cytochrome c reductase cytochrome c1 subunit
MMRIYILIVFILTAQVSWAAGESSMPYEFSENLSDQAALQRGARTFVNYCLSCHSAAYMRFNRMGQDLGIPDSVLLENFMFGTDKVGSTMNVAMTKDSANQYFGIAPPDLSVTARSRGPEWLYNYLMTFYLDSSKPAGVNNLIFKDVAMPHVLWELQGWQEAVYVEETGEDGLPIKRIDHLQMTSQLGNKPEVYQDETYEEIVSDLVNFMVYLGEPIKLQRYSFGIWVILYMVFLLIIVYFLKKEYWKDIH